MLFQQPQLPHFELLKIHRYQPIHSPLSRKPSWDADIFQIFSALSSFSYIKKEAAPDGAARGEKDGLFRGVLIERKLKLALGCRRGIVQHDIVTLKPDDAVLRESIRRSADTQLHLSLGGHDGEVVAERAFGRVFNHDLLANPCAPRLSNRNGLQLSGAHGSRSIILSEETGGRTPGSPRRAKFTQR